MKKVDIHCGIDISKLVIFLYHFVNTFKLTQHRTAKGNAPGKGTFPIVIDYIVLAHLKLTDIIMKLVFSSELQKTVARLSHRIHELETQSSDTIKVCKDYFWYSFISVYLNSLQMQRFQFGRQSIQLQSKYLILINQVSRNSSFLR